MNVGISPGIQGYREALTRVEMNNLVIQKYKLCIGKVLKVVVRNADRFNAKEIKKAKIISMCNEFITLADCKNPNIKYTLYYYNLKDNIA